MSDIPHNTSNRHDNHSTTAEQGIWSTRRIATLAILCAAALILSFIEIPIFPLAPWLKFDASSVVALVAGFAYGPTTGILVAVLSWLVHLLFSFNPYGVLMAVLALVSIVGPAAFIYRRKLTMSAAVVGMIVGGICSLAVCILANLLITPLYTSVDVQSVIAMIIPILLPFNVLKIVLECGLCLLIYKPLSKALTL